MTPLGFPPDLIVLFIGLTSAALWLDLHLHHHSQAISIRDALMWSAVWIGLALVFYGYLFVQFAPYYANLFLAGYLLEKALSVDNLMVFVAIFAAFGINDGRQHRVLYYGVLGAVVFRLLFIGAGTWLFHMSAWVELLFAGIVAYSGYVMLTAGDHQDIEDYSHHWSVTYTKRLIPVIPRLFGDRFFIRHQDLGDDFMRMENINLHRQANYYATPLLLCVVCVEATDVVFAFDSVPAVIAVTREPLLVYSAMIFAILGLRSLYFVLAAAHKNLPHLGVAVSLLLFFIGFKLAYNAVNHLFALHWVELSNSLSLIVIALTLGGGVVASLMWPEPAQS